MKIHFWFVIWVCFISSNIAQQFYDPSDCSSLTNQLGSRYTCENSFQNSCHTFVVYRANQRFNTICNVSDLFHIEANELLGLNNPKYPAEMLRSGRDVLVPVNCSCTGQFFRANVSYIVSEITPPSEIACGVFEGLLKSLTLIQENPPQVDVLEVGSKLNLPLRCACPDNVSSSNGVKYLVTYPIVEGDEPIALSNKFGISAEDMWAANHLEPRATVYPNTTLLIPLKGEPVIDFRIPDSPPPAPGFLPTVTVEKASNRKLRILYIAGSVVGFPLVLVAVIACVLYLKTTNKWKGEKLQSLSGRSTPLSCSTPISSPRSGRTGRTSTNSCLSPDLLAGIKYSLRNYSMDDIKRVTKDFSEERRIGDEAYKGSIDNLQVMIKEMRFEDTRHIIDVHSKINHINILNLHGVCYGESDFSWSYLLFELPSNGCLRDCLTNPLSPLKWHIRTQIAFDIAEGLHYLHHCIFPSYAHMKVNTKNIFLTANWRAKLANIGTPTAIGSSSTGLEKSVAIKGWIAPEYVLNDSASEKVDIFAFGVVLFELISARKDMDGNLFKDSIGFLGGAGSEGGCFEQLRSFMDPCLKDEYPLAEALCLAVLAKACVEDDPLHRPSMDDIIKVLARMLELSKQYITKNIKFHHNVRTVDQWE
ncbi:lysM domain receptor-like kinase 4 isoform X1 [Tripterygium wilfordii]|uniref:lysM domain receptor-like kinase 4 isoform X1 n=1 Tax=Tripterygium wilfordii TaxID=458696 RepID=UPI0018F8188F|nr:lysM domain receptor-like kinase 4 isoform X1 [Tripterygium wilfordii]